MYFLVIASEQLDPRQRLQVVGALEHYGQWEVIADGVYAVNCPAKLEDVRRDFRQRLGSASGLTVVPLNIPETPPEPGKLKDWIAARVARPPQADPSLQ